MTDAFNDEPLDDDLVAPVGNEAAMLDQDRPVDTDPRNVVPRVISDDPEVPAADAWEQSLPVGVDDDY